MTCENCTYERICNRHNLFNNKGGFVKYVYYTPETCADFQWMNSAVTNSILKEYKEVIHARWIWCEGSYRRECRCSYCNCELPYVLVGGDTVDHTYPEIEYIETTKFCPECGAQMNEDE